MQVPTVRQVHLVIGDIVKFVMHVARRIDMDAGGDERHDHEHQHRQGVDVPADREPEVAALVERVPVARVGRRNAGCMVLAMPAGVGVPTGLGVITMIIMCVGRMAIRMRRIR